MRNNIAFRLSAQNSLKINQITHKEQKNLLNTFKAGSDLRTQLNKVKLLTKPSKIDGTNSFSKQQKKAQQEILAQEVAALEHFKAPVTRQKTKNLIENIKLRRRQKHIDTLGRFKQDVDEYNQTLTSAYQSLANDIEQVMTIKLNSVQDFLTSCDKKQFLLSRQKDLISDIQEQVMNYRIQSQAKLNFAKDELTRIKNDRSQMAHEICNSLCLALIEIAFVLQPEAKQIEAKYRQQIRVTEQNFFTQYTQKITKIIQQQQKRNQLVESHSTKVIDNWKTQKQQYQLLKYNQDAQSDSLRRNNKLRSTFNYLIEEQMKNHQRKVKLLNNLILQDPDCLSKTNIDKFNEAVKKINDNFDSTLDQILVQFRQGNNNNKKQNQQRLKKCKERLVYIQKHTPQEVQTIIEQKCNILCKRNIDEQQELIKKATNYAQNQDEKQNKVIQILTKFILKIGVENDNFIKEFSGLNQKYEIEKAKILDDDEETVEKLTQQLNKLKVQLKESLHHIKLEEIQKKCFDKVDQIQKAYRACHEKNKSLKQTRTPSLNQFMKKYEAKLAQILELFAPSRRAELQQKNKKQCEEQALKRIQAEQKKKAQQEQKLIQQAKAKGGKPPPPAKPKDPKKAAAQLQQRKKAILVQIGTKKIQQIKTQTGSVWLVFKSIVEICENFYKQAHKQLAQSKGENKQQTKIDEQKSKALDAAQQGLKDCRNVVIVNQKSLLKLSQIIPMLQTLRTTIFDSIASKKTRIISQSEKIDEQMLQQSLINLDNRLKKHYSLKGKIQSEIFVKRSGEITNHKKKYQKYARTIKQKIDLQTQKFNFLLEKGLQSLKNHISQQKSMKEHIPKCKNLSELQGMYSRTRQNFNTFGITIKQIYNELERFGNSEIDILFKKNQDFIKQSKLMKDGGDYSNQQIAWYEQMMAQITTQMKEQQQKRQQKLAELKQHSEKKKQQLFQSFEKQYNIAVQQMAARDGTGKKYGRPKRIAQQKTRLQMNKCQQAQININKMIAEISKQYQKLAKNNFKHKEFPQVLEWRRRLMAIQFCIMKYSKHIEALKPDLKIAPMIRVTYNLSNPEAKLAPQQQQQDKKRRQTQLKALGKLSDQKDERPFLKYIQQIQKLISDESRTIYVGDKAKFLTGNDKIPDFLRTYISSMKKSCEAFRVTCVRDLRQSCIKFADLSSNISELFFSSIISYFENKQTQCKDSILKKFIQLSSKHKSARTENTKKLRPNLLNPKCQNQLRQLDQKQNQRNEQYTKNIESVQIQFKDKLYKIGQELLNCLLNNYEFLLILTDAFYLSEDFMTLPGDDVQDKSHLQTHKLLLMKQKGIKIDPMSQRNLRKKWDGFDYSIFNIQNRKYQYKRAQEAPKQKDKKAGKKDTKDPKKQQEVPQDSDPNKSKTIETFKTWRQKIVFQARSNVTTNFKAIYNKTLQQINCKIQQDKKQNAVHSKKWRQTADSLYIK